MEADSAQAHRSALMRRQSDEKSGKWQARPGFPPAYLSRLRKRTFTALVAWAALAAWGGSCLPHLAGGARGRRGRSGERVGEKQSVSISSERSGRSGREGWGGVGGRAARGGDGMNGVEMRAAVAQVCPECAAEAREPAHQRDLQQQCRCSTDCREV